MRIDFYALIPTPRVPYLIASDLSRHGLVVCLDGQRRLITENLRSPNANYNDSLMLSVLYGNTG